MKFTFLKVVFGAETWTDIQVASIGLALALLHLQQRLALPLEPLALWERALLAPTKRNRIGTVSEQRVQTTAKEAKSYLYLFLIAFVELLSPLSLEIC